MGTGSCVGTGVSVGSGASVGAGVSVGTGDSVGVGLSVGTGASVGSGASVSTGASVGCGISVGSRRKEATRSPAVKNRFITNPPMFLLIARRLRLHRNTGKIEVVSHHHLPGNKMTFPHSCILHLQNTASQIPL